MDSECNFTIGHYKYLISEALHSGYKFCSFNEPTLSDQRVIFLRHDIDVPIDMALKMAEVETELGVRSTYFALPNCSTYNLLEDASLKKLVQIAEMGHWIGLHIDLPCTVSEAHAIEEIAYAMFVFYANFLPLSPVVSFHRPQPQIFTIKLPTLVNTYEDRFFKEIKYISDSRGQWREGCPCKMFRGANHPVVQMLIHPVWWITDRDVNEAWACILENRKTVMKEYLGINVSPFGVLLANS